MFWFLKNHPFAIGVDMAEDGLRLAQLAHSQNGIGLIANFSKNQSENVTTGSVNWQRWAIEVIREATANGSFRGKNVIAAIPANEVFIDHIRKPKTDEGKLEDAVFARIKHKLTFQPTKENTLIKCIPMEEDNLLVMATERKIIDRHLAIYEKANLQIKSIGVWPIALTNCYSRFFGRRKYDTDVIVMLLNIETKYTNVVICRHKNLLFARSVPIGAKQLSSENNDDRMITRLVMELTSCRRQFGSMYRNNQTERLIFLSGQAVDRQICTAIAKQLEMPAQLGDCLAAVQVIHPCHSNKKDACDKAYTNTSIKKGDNHINWATSFGLSLS